MTSSSTPVRPSPHEAFRSFVREFARCPQKTEMLDRLTHGHQPDKHGWCNHHAHAHHWERHPCPTLQLAELVNAAGHVERDNTDAEQAITQYVAGR